MVSQPEIPINSDQKCPSAKSQFSPQHLKHVSGSPDFNELLLSLPFWLSAPDPKLPTLQVHYLSHQTQQTTKAHSACDIEKDRAAEEPSSESSTSLCYEIVASRSLAQRADKIQIKPNAFLPLGKINSKNTENITWAFVLSPLSSSIACESS